MEIVNLVLGWFHTLPDWFHAISGVVTAAAAVAALTPTPKDDEALASVRKVIDWLALNVLNAKNK